MEADNLLDELIISMYGDPPPSKRANVEQAISLAADNLLEGIVDEHEVRAKAEQLNAGPIPYSTHDLAISVALHFFKEPSYVPQLEDVQLIARMTALQWSQENLAAPVLVKSFEDTLYDQNKRGFSQREAADDPEEHKDVTRTNEEESGHFEPLKGNAENDLKKAAEQGDADAQEALGLMYAEGQGVEQDFKEAVKWYQKAADQGNADAQETLGLYYETGLPGGKDFKEAVKWYQKAADQGNDGGQFGLGRMYYHGDGVEQDFKEAVKWFQKAAEQGCDGGQFHLGIIYRDGQGVEQDFKEAVKWFRKAADQGNETAQRDLAAMYDEGKGVEQDFKEAFKWFQKAADQGNTDAQRELAARYDEGKGVEKDEKEAEEWFENAADQDQGQRSASWCAFGGMLATGKGVEQDFKEAVKFFQKAADQGFAEGQFNLGRMYYFGKGVERDSKEAFKWQQKAADQGYASAQHHLGVMYRKGQGVEQDFKEAFKWYQKAADQGNVTAQCSLGAMYENGEGVEQDFKEASKWYQKAADQGLPRAQAALSKISSKKPSSTVTPVIPSTKDQNLQDEEIYDLIADELANGKRKEGLWLKAETESDGDQEKAKHEYVKWRYEQLRTKTKGNPKKATGTNQTAKLWEELLPMVKEYLLLLEKLESLENEISKSTGTLKSLFKNVFSKIPYDSFFQRSKILAESFSGLSSKLDSYEQSCKNSGDEKLYKLSVVLLVPIRSACVESELVKERQRLFYDPEQSPPTVHEKVKYTDISEAQKLVENRRRARLGYDDILFRRLKMENLI
jgi:TPR repeat protein